MCIEIIPIKGIPRISEKVDFADILIQAITNEGPKVQEEDIFVIAQIVVSKSEGRIVHTSNVEASPRAEKIAEMNGFDPVQVELAIRESVDIIQDQDVLITETHQGIVCNFSGVDRSNAPEDSYVLLPEDPDKSAQQIREKLQTHFGCRLAVIISDTQGRPWRRGSINVAIGCSGINAFKKNRGMQDIYGYTLKRSDVCHVDEIASAVEPLMGQADEATPVVIVRGYKFDIGPETANSIPRSRNRDLFR